MRSPDNPFFARSFVNRVWGHYFGVGIVDPVDNFSLANPPSNPKLLDALARDFVEQQVRHPPAGAHHPELSRTYQLTSARQRRPTSWTATTTRTAYLRPMMAEVVVDVLDDALGVKEKFGTDGAAGRPGHRDRRQPGATATGELRLPHLRPAAADHAPATASGRWSRPCRRRCT